MKVSGTTALRRLRQADPVARGTCRVNLDQAVPPALRTVSPPSSGPFPAGGTFAAATPRRRVLPRAVLVTAVAAVALAIGSTRLPWSDDEAVPTASAYAVTAEPDGSVGVTVRWSQLSDPGALQAALRANEVPAVVLLESGPGGCPQPRQDGIKLPEGALVPGTGSSPDRQRFTIRPVLIPAGGTVVIGVPRIEGPASSATLYVTDQTPPTCLRPTTQLAPAN